MNYVCAECQKPFSAPPAWRKVCCTRACSDRHRKRLRLKPCAQCGVMFYPIGGRAEQQRCCSQACDRSMKVAIRRGHKPPTPIDGASWIELGDGEFALVDASDAVVLNGYTWWKHVTGYPACKVDGKQVKMHQILMPGVAMVDHVNRNTLDNRRANLRAATRSGNGANRGRLSNNTSGYKGVSRYGVKWGARAGVRGDRIFLGVFDTREQAAAAYDEAMLAGHGEFAAPNGAG